MHDRDDDGPRPSHRFAGATHVIAALLAAALLLVGALVAYASVRRIVENDGRVVHSHDVLDALGGVSATLTMAESSARAYLITGDAGDLPPYRSAVATIDSGMKRLRRLVVEEPAQRARIPLLRRLVAGRLGELERTVWLRQRGFLEARGEVMTDVGRATMNAIRDEIAEGTRLERALLALRQRESARSYRVALSNGVAVVVAGLLMIAALTSFIRRDLRERALVAERLAEADRKKDEFLATIAHELRNPLAPLRAAADTLRLSGERRHVARQALDILTRQVRTMGRLVDDLLDVGRIQNGALKLRKETLDLVLLVRQSVEACAPAARAAGHELRLAVPDEPVFVCADATRLGQIFANLLTNAVKYTPEGGHIQVTVQATQARGMVRVRDDGIGIPREMLPRVFDMYAQVDAASRRSQGGLGIGLAVARRLLAAQNAAIEARSAGPGKGSEFVVRLPRVPAPAVVAAPPRRRAPAIEPAAAKPFSRRILVVDDDADAAEGLAGFLGLLGHEVRTARDGPSALAQTAAFAPDLVLLDIGLPGMSGYEVARRIRRDPANAHVVLVAQTGWAREEDRLRSAEAGFDHHLAKPLDPGALETLIGSLAS